MARRRRASGGLVVRALIVLAALGVLAYAVEGGEWGTVDLMRQTKGLARLRHDVDSLGHEVDSLRKYKQALLTDPVTQEKVAREEFGMVRNKEMLYRFTEPDSMSPKSEAGSRKR